MLAEAESVSKIMAQLEPLFQKDELREVFFIFYFFIFYFFIAQLEPLF